MDHKRVLNYFDKGYRAEEIPPFEYTIRPIDKTFETINPQICVLDRKSKDVVLIASYNSYLKLEPGEGLVWAKSIMDCKRKEHDKWIETQISNVGGLVEPIRKAGDEALRHYRKKGICQEKDTATNEEIMTWATEISDREKKGHNFEEIAKINQIANMQPGDIREIATAIKDKYPSLNKEVSKAEEKKPIVKVVRRKNQRGENQR